MGGAQWMVRRKADMQHLLISIRLPEGHWAGDLTRSTPGISIRVDEHMALPEGRGISTVFITGDGIDHFVQDLEKHEGIENASFFDEHEDTIEMSITIARHGGGFLRPLIKAEVTPQTPFIVRDGWVEWEFVTDHKHVKKLVKGLKESELPHRIHSLSKESSSRLLTVRQREVFDLAVSEGYYDNPRRITLTALAEIVGVAKSTLCEMVRIIENNIIDEFADSVRRQSPKD